MQKEYHTPIPEGSKKTDTYPVRLKFFDNNGCLKEDDYITFYRENAKIGRFTIACLSWNFKS